MLTHDDMLNTVTQGDCLELIENINPGSVDMVLCDLPYGTTRNKWDSVLPLDMLWAGYRRVLSPSGVAVLTAQSPFDKVLGCSNLNWLKYEWIWIKNVATGHLNANRAPMKIHENVLVFYDSTCTYNPQMQSGKPYKMKRKPVNDNGSNYGIITRTDTINKGERFPVSTLQFNRETGLHPTQKPVPLFEYLIRTYTSPGALVLDNCCGSGTTGIACLNSGRNFIQIEREEAYCNIALERIGNWIPPAPQEPQSK